MTTSRYPSATAITIYHNPRCSTSRNVLALIRNTGEEPEIIDYLKTPPSREKLVELLSRMGITAGELLRRKESLVAELGLGDPSIADEVLIDAMAAHPILMNRPIVITPLGARLCRPSEAVLDILPSPHRASFNKEDGEAVIDGRGQQIVR
ncbi:MAG: arsenate reductase (glutaredoxin) [Comamonadaceae bacterium]|nr:MAG: arsenate reductase (glutaredoxin) [Comamonadaceae bacterium]